ncbi:MAG: amylo-alpha-1,6-glucosidase [Anaerolineaceae bacterium]
MIENKTKDNETVCNQLKNRIDIERVPFTDRGSRLLVLRNNTGLLIRLAERWYKNDNRLSAYRDRPAIIDSLRFTDNQGVTLETTLDSYPDRLDFNTRLGTFSIAFLDNESLFFSLPGPECGIAFHALMDIGQTDRRGGFLRVTGNIRRNMAYTTNRRYLKNEISQVEASSHDVNLIFEKGQPEGFLLNLTPRLGFNRYLPSCDKVFAKSGQHWEEWFSRVPGVGEKYLNTYYYAWWIMCAGLISTRFYTTRESMTPSKLHYVGIWQWDALFHAIAYRYNFPRLAQDQIRVVLDHQAPNGMIPDAVHDEGTITHLDFPVEADVTKPPLIAWAAWKLYEGCQDVEFIQEIYEPIVRWNQWWLNNNDLDGDGLCEYQHPFSSGLDDSPLWDGGMPVTSPDLNTYLVLQMENLGRMAAVLGMKEEAAEWEEKASLHLKKIIAVLWDEEAGVFQARRGGQTVPILTPFHLFPLITGRLPQPIAKKLVKKLTDPFTFWPPFPVPTVALNDPCYDPAQMWRGPAWINVNYLLIEGLERSGFADEAVDLRRKTLDLVNGHPDIHEYYDSRTGEPCPKAAPIFGWSAALFIDLVLQEESSRKHP